jgi:anionic cell wall polymer biosynthesis LytR-Cps2A-Psr (LCP) family protein
MKFDGYISMTMDAVKVIVDSLGGVEVLIEDNDLTAYDPSFVKGSKVTLNGELALKFVRARSGLEDATNAARMRRQETFLRALFAKLSEKSIESSFDFYDTISSKLVSNMYDTEQLEIVNKISEYKYQDSLVIDGEYRMGDKYWEFYASEDSIEQILIGAFYEKAN